VRASFALASCWECTLGFFGTVENHPKVMPDNSILPCPATFRWELRAPVSVAQPDLFPAYLVTKPPALEVLTTLGMVVKVDGFLARLAPQFLEESTSVVAPHFSIDATNDVMQPAVVVLGLCNDGKRWFTLLQPCRL